jgi:hypothetical protein
MGDFLKFRKMITPVFIQVVFWLGLLGNLVASIVLISRGGVSVLGGFLLLLFGSLMVRVYCELIILLFRIYDSLKNIERKGSGSVA